MSGFYHQDERDRAATIGAYAMLLFYLLLSFLFFSTLAASCSTTDEVRSCVAEAEADVYEFAYDKLQDMQLPELPTGNEPTAAATLIRLATGRYVTKQEVADAMPKSSVDFVNCFLGDPYTDNGYTCWAPCVASTIGKFLRSNYVVEDCTGTDFIDNRVPFYAYVTEDMEDPIWYSEDSELGKGYKIAHNCNAIVVRRIDALNNKVYCYDPLHEGIMIYDYDRVEEVYNEMGKQAVSIASVPVEGVDY